MITITWSIIIITIVPIYLRRNTHAFWIQITHSHCKQSQLPTVGYSHIVNKNRDIDICRHIPRPTYQTKKNIQVIKSCRYRLSSNVTASVGYSVIAKIIMLTIIFWTYSITIRVIARCLNNAIDSITWKTVIHCNRLPLHILRLPRSLPY